MSVYRDLGVSAVTGSRSCTSPCRTRRRSIHWPRRSSTRRSGIPRLLEGHGKGQRSACLWSRTFRCQVRRGRSLEVLLPSRLICFVAPMAAGCGRARDARPIAIRGAGDAAALNEWVFQSGPCTVTPRQPLPAILSTPTSTAGTQTGGCWFHMNRRSVDAGDFSYGLTGGHRLVRGRRIAGRRRSPWLDPRPSPPPPGAPRGRPGARKRARAATGRTGRCRAR